MKEYNINWNEYFRLEDNSPSGLVRIRNRVGTKIDPRIIGTQAFQKNGDPCGWTLKFKYKQYYVHRIIWVLAYGSIDPNLVIDHLDGNPFNNLIDNLKLKTSADNNRNRRQQWNNTTGVTGVRLTEMKNGSLYYSAMWRELDGKLKMKHFSINKLGEGPAKVLAISHREQQIQRLNLEGAVYTNRHLNKQNDN